MYRCSVRSTGKECAVSSPGYLVALGLAIALSQLVSGAFANDATSRPSTGEAVTAQGQAETKELPPLPKGISTWVYGYRDGISKKVHTFNTLAVPNLRFKYFFPYAGSLGFSDAPPLGEMLGSEAALPPRSTVQELSRFEAPSQYGDNYYARVRGYVHPPKTGEYTFYIASDDGSELWLSADDDPSNKKQIASVSRWTSPGEWDKYKDQKSAPVRLETGRSYYVEVLHHEKGGGDHLAVAWEGPDFARTVIDGEFLSSTQKPQERGTVVWEKWQAAEINAAIPAPRKGQFELYFNGKMAVAYAEALPAGTLIMPIVDGRADEGEFSGWTDDQYRAAAAAVAARIIAEPYAAGVQIDVEPFRPDHLPFYRHLTVLLNAEGKYCTMFVGPKNKELLTRIFQSCNVVVMSGYDLNGEGMPLNSYASAMKTSVARFDEVARETGRHYMIGIPAAASWGEFELLLRKDGTRKETGVKHEEYVRAALDAVKPFLDSPHYVGLSLWVMTDPETAVEEPVDTTKPGRYPNVIRESVWKMLESY
jgi:hypothetical protein